MEAAKRNNQIARKDTRELTSAGLTSFLFHIILLKEIIIKINKTKKHKQKYEHNSNNFYDIKIK